MPHNELNIVLASAFLFADVGAIVWISRYPSTTSRNSAIVGLVGALGLAARWLFI